MNDRELSEIEQTEREWRRRALYSSDAQTQARSIEAERVAYRAEMGDNSDD